MAGTVKVDTQKLRSVAGEFQNTRSQIKSLTSNMMQTVGALTGTVWSGDAASSYTGKFNGLQSEMTKIDQMINEHVDDLNNMATAYEQGENAAQQEASNAYKEYFITVMKDGKVDDSEKTTTIGDFTLELAADGTLVSVTSDEYTFTVVDGAITKVEPKN
jgi:WXG100 family type VII secretion target